MQKGHGDDDDNYDDDDDDLWAIRTLQILAYNYIDKYEYNNIEILLAEVMLWRENSAFRFSTN